ncbi:MAG: N-6 DNA methylase [Thaumarchaeota archaeon]|nr:N-6 DNA methylase [Nitrososphaerota archaeon]
MTVFRPFTRAAFRVLQHYQSHRVAGAAPRVLQYLEVWRELHKNTVNITEEGWRAIEGMTSAIGVTLQRNNRSDREMALFAIQTYLSLLIRAVTLNKLGQSPVNVGDFKNLLRQFRNIIQPSIFEWVFEAVDDQSLPIGLRREFENALNAMLTILASVNLLAASFDFFREIYQNILPREIRRTLGEFYTKDDIVEEVLDAAGLTRDEILKLYNDWRRRQGGDANGSVKIVDPACGSGTFLVHVIRRMFDAIGCVPDIIRFIEETVIGVDVNPFAVDMARMNYAIVLTEEMVGRCKSSPLISKIPILWADSLTKIKYEKMVTNLGYYTIDVPSLSKLVGGPIKVPDPASFYNVEVLIDDIVNAVIHGRSFNDFVNQLISRPPSSGVAQNLSWYTNILQSLYDCISRIYKSGNHRQIELLKNSLRVISLINSCRYVIGNPPWVRIHKISDSVRKVLKSEYKFYGRDAEYDPKFERTKIPFRSQYDYSMAFVERGLEFLVEGGVLSYVITSKITQTTYAGKLRSTILNETTILRIIDYSLYPVPLFVDVVNYPLIIAVRKEQPQSDHKVKITLYNTRGDRRDFTQRQKDLPLHINDGKSPWVIAPPQIIQVMRKIQASGTRLGDIYEVMMGVKTSLNRAYIVSEVKKCVGRVAEVVLEDGNTTLIEEFLIHPMVRGEDVDPFSYTVNYYIIFPHDPETMKPLWDPAQKEVIKVILEASGRKVRVGSTGNTLIYECEVPASQIEQAVKLLTHKGFTVSRISPHSAYACYEIMKQNAGRLKIIISSLNEKKTRVYVEGLYIPGAPYATRHFLANLEKLIKRDDYKSSLPPWAVFRTSIKKKGMKIAWQENAKFFEACVLPDVIRANVCDNAAKQLIPIQTTYFIKEDEPSRRYKLVLYLNSEIARALMKLIAWKARGGYFRHISMAVGQLPIPDMLRECEVWSEVSQELVSAELDEINDRLRRFHEEKGEKLEQQLAEKLKLTPDELEDLREFSRWLNQMDRSL